MTIKNRLVKSFELTRIFKCKKPSIGGKQKVLKKEAIINTTLSRYNQRIVKVGRFIGPAIMQIFGLDPPGGKNRNPATVILCPGITASVEYGEFMKEVL